MEQSNFKTEIEKSGAISFVPKGNSMWPFLKNKKQSVIIIKKQGKLSKYDVALYVRENGDFVLHRVIEPTDFGYIICGDSQFSLEKVNEDQVFGVLHGFYKGRKLIDPKNAKLIKKVDKWYSNEKRKRRILKWFFRFNHLKNILKREKNNKENDNV